MRNPSKHTRLQYVRGQMFSCGMFGACSDSVLSPHTPPPIVEPVCLTNTSASTSSSDGGDPVPIISSSHQQREGKLIIEEQKHIDSISSLTQWDFHIRRLDKGHKLAGIELRSSERCSSELEGGDLQVHLGPQSYPSLSPSSSSSSSSSYSHLHLVERFLVELSRGLPSLASLRSLRLLVQESDSSSRSWVSREPIVSGLAFLLAASNPFPPEHTQEFEICEEALAVLSSLAEHEGARAIMSQPQILPAVSRHLNARSMVSRTSAVTLLERVSASERFAVQIGATNGVMEGIVRIVRQEKQLRALKYAIKALMALCLVEENRLPAVRAGAVGSLLEILPDVRDVSAERALATLNLLCTTAEGQAAMRQHALAIPLLLDMILKVSDRGSEYAAGTLCAICGSEGEIDVQEVALQAGALTQLLLLLQSDCTSRARRKALQLLKVLHRVWGVGNACKENGCPDSTGS